GDFTYIHVPPCVDAYVQFRAQLAIQLVVVVGIAAIAAITLHSKLDAPALVSVPATIAAAGIAGSFIFMPTWPSLKATWRTGRERVVFAVDATTVAMRAVSPHGERNK